MTLGRFGDVGGMVSSMSWRADGSLIGGPLAVRILLQANDYRGIASRTQWRIITMNQSSVEVGAGLVHSIISSVPTMPTMPFWLKPARGLESDRDFFLLPLGPSSSHFPSLAAIGGNVPSRQGTTTILLIYPLGLLRRSWP